jgi:hypothetical protein
MSHPKHSFRQIVALLSNQFGNLNLGINQNANSLDELLPADGVHRPVVHSMLQNIYQRNKCTSLDSKILMSQTFDALGDLAWELKSAKHAELDALTLLEQIGECLAEFWSSTQQDSNPTPTGSTPSASSIKNPGSADNSKPKSTGPVQFRLPS